MKGRLFTGCTLAIALGFILSSWLVFTPQAFAEKKMSRNGRAIPEDVRNRAEGGMGDP